MICWRNKKFTYKIMKNYPSYRCFWFAFVCRIIFYNFACKCLIMPRDQNLSIIIDNFFLVNNSIDSGFIDSYQ